jgi:two-component system chemotaxis response regulator CheY
MATILAIDDSEVFRIQIRDLLQGHQVIEAVDGLDGLAKLAANRHVELIICDVNMPNMDGMTFCRKKSENPEFAKVPVVMITTESHPDLKKTAKQYGVVLPSKSDAELIDSNKNLLTQRPI